jgi:hypothetical protein
MNDSNRNTLITLTGALGCLLLASDAEHSVAVIDSDGERLTLAPTDRAAASLIPGVHLLGVLEAGSPRGVVRMLGDAVLSAADSICFAVVDVLEIRQRRSFVRRCVARPIIIETLPEHLRIESFALDMSGGGLLVAASDQLEPGQRAAFRLSLRRGEAPIEGEARVVRIDARGGRALAFESLAARDRERLIQFVFERERNERRGERDGRPD